MSNKCLTLKHLAFDLSIVVAARSTHADSEGTDNNLDTVGASLLCLVFLVRLDFIENAGSHQVSPTEASYRSGDNPHFVTMENKLQAVL